MRRFFVLLVSCFTFFVFLSNNAIYSKEISSLNEINFQNSAHELSAEEEKQIFDLIQREPSFSEFQKKVLQFAAIPTSEDFQKFRKQAKVRNLLPNISSDLDMGKNRYNDNGWGSNYSITRPNSGASVSNSFNSTGVLTNSGGNLTYNNNDASSSNDGSMRTGDDAGLGISLDLNLSNVLYDDEVTDILSEQRRFATIRSDYMDRAFDAYHERRNKQIYLIINPPKNKTEKIIAKMELHNLTDRLDSLTGGWFGKALKYKAMDRPLAK